VNTAEKYRAQFEEEAMQFRSFLEDILENPESLQQIPSVTEELFRTAHSLKSGAGFLNLHSLESAAHRLEDYLSGNPNLGKSSALEGAIREVLALLGSAQFGGSNRYEVHEQRSGEGEGENHEPRRKKLSDFELLLLEEARFRGEKLYRVECRIDREEPMKRARAYLVLNKLELHCNVIKTEPAMEEESALFTPFILYITSKQRQREIKALLNFDRIERIDIQELSLNELDNLRFGDEVIFSGIMEEKKNRLSIERDDLEDLLSLWEELSQSLKQSPWAGEKERLQRILEEGDKKLLQISRFSLQEIFPELKEKVREYGNRIKRKAELHLEGGSLMLPREWMSPILRILQQLVRNSLVHGIEGSQERIDKGKDPAGQLNLSLTENEGVLILAYSDDGRGIDEGQLRRKVALDSSPTIDQDKSLLQLILTRGLSSSNKADTFSGRGIGMDLLYQAVENELHGRLSLENYPGQGLRFIIEIPFSKDQVYLQFRYRGAVYLVDRKYIRETGTLHIDSLYKNRTGHYHMKDRDFLPLYSVMGPLSQVQDLKGCPFWLKLRYMGKTACLLAEDLMVEKHLRIPAASVSTNGALKKLDHNTFLLMPNLIE